jgi:hypothetical protein
MDPVTAALATQIGTTGMTVGGLASGAMTGFSLLQGIQSGFQQEAGFKQQAEGVKEQAHMEKIKAQEESNLRRERLLNALAAQNVQAGAGGVKGGTTEALKLQSTDEYGKEQAGADLYSSAKQSGYKRQAEGLVQQGKTAKRKALISTATQLASIG